MLRYKIRPLEELKKAGYSTYKIKNDKIFGGADVTNMKREILPSHSVLDKLCRLLNCQPGDIIEYIDEQG